MSLQKISRVDNIRMFIREYYLGQKTWVKINRIIGGPTIIVCGVILLNQSKKFAIAYGGFCLVYGIYLFLKPLLFIVLKNNLFKANSLELVLNDEELRGKKDGVESIIKLDYFQNIERKSFYYKLTTKAAGVIYLVVNQLTQEERQILDNRLTT